MVGKPRKLQPDSSAQEIRSLKARIAELEAKQGSRPMVSEDTKEQFWNVRTDAQDELGRILRGVVRASVEDLRSSADSLNDGLDEWAARLDKRKATQPSTDETKQSKSDELADEIEDVMSAVVVALDRAVKGPSRVIDRFMDEYRGSAEEESRSAKS